MNTHSQPASEDRLRRRARQYLDNHQLDAAQSTLEALLEQVPGDVHARMELARVMLVRGQLRESNRQLLRIVRALPNDAPLLAQLAQRLYLNGETLAARACLDHLERAPDPPAEVLAAQANLRWMLGEIAAAKTLMDRAVAMGAEGYEENYLQALLCQFTGDIDGAERVLTDLLRRWPAYAAAAVVLANLRTQTEHTQHLDLLREQGQRFPADSAAAGERFARAHYESALFKELDDLGRHDEAWPALAQCNALMRALNAYDAAAEVSVTDAIIRHSAAPGSAEGDPTVAHEGPMPIFIVGMPRSGSTLLDRMLSSHSQVTSAGEINDFMRQLRLITDVPSAGPQSTLKMLERSADIDVAALGERYLKQTQWRAQGRRFYVDKLPSNLRVVNLIRRALPQAVILHTMRAPMDVCFSNFKAMFGNASAYSYDQQSLAHYHGQYMRLVEHWHATLPGAMLDVSHAALVEDPEFVIGQVLQHCGLDFEEACAHPDRNTAPVATRSSSQVRDAIHGRSVGQWSDYAAQLQPLREALGMPG